MLIRTARAKDAAALTPLFRQWQHPQPVATITAQIAAWQQTCYAEILVAEADTALGGMAAVSTAPHLSRLGWYARLAGLVVDAGHRRLNIGAALLQTAEQRAREWGCDHMELTSARSRTSIGKRGLSRCR